MEIRNASFAQVVRGRDGRKITIDADVGGIVGQIKELDPSLSVFWNEIGNYFVVVEMCADGAERLVTTTQELDQRLVDHLRKISAPGWDVGREMEKQDAQADRDAAHRLHEEVGPKAEVLAHALRKDLGYQGKVFLP